MSRSLLSVACCAVVLSLPFGAIAQTPAKGKPSGAKPGGPVAPFAGQGKPMTSEEALKSVAKLDRNLAPLEKDMNAAQAKLKKKPKDAKLKTAYVDATYKYGHAVMMDQGKLSPKVQYRAALALYRRALAVDPKHQPSLNDKKMIEDIYTQMGMPVPK